MTSITQQIPSYVGGISQQPDELKVPGQVRTAKNVLPDVTHGLLKRPGGRLIGSALSAYTTDSKWFHYYRDENEQYIGQIQLSTGSLKMWRCSDGSEYTQANNKITYQSGKETEIKNYLKQTNSGGTITDADLQTLTLNDYTYITNRNKPTAMSADTAQFQNDAVKRPQAFIELKKVAYGKQYTVNIYDGATLNIERTATRIRVELVKSSNNYCNSNGSLPNRTNRLTQTTRCDDSAGDNRDAFAPNVGTRIFSIDDDMTLTDEGPSNPGSPYSYTLHVIAANGHQTPSGSPRGKNLYFRVTTTGQSVPYSETSGTGSNATVTTTYQARYTTTWDLLYGGEEWQEGDHFYFWMNDGRYKLTVESVSEAKVLGNIGRVRPEPTSFDTKTTVTAESIIGSLRAEIAALSAFGDTAVQIIGNGIWIVRPVADGTFNVSTPSADLLNVISDEVKDVADLPKQCKHEYTVKVANSEAEEDDYYVKFVGTNGRDGDGVWEECPQPGIKTTFDPATMPIQIVRQADGSFRVEQIPWEDRLVGDTVTVPEPSFIGQTINKMLFFRNRMVMLSDENVIMSQPGSFYNFWPKSAITYTATDNIDISCSSEYPAIVYDGIQVNAGLVLFTKNQQFMLTTDSDVLSPLTAKINSLSSYNFNFNTNPISLGTTLAFLDNAGKYTRFFEMQSVLREGEPNVIEQSKNISKLFPKDINLIANSRENATIFFTTKGTNTIYGFRYYQTGEQRVQQAWFNWELNGTVQHMAMLDDALYVIVKNSSTYTMQKFSIKLDDNSHAIVEDATYRVHLDNAKTFAHTNLTYVANGDYTKFDHTAANFAHSGQLYVVALSTGSDKQFNGLISKVTTFQDATDGNKVKIKIPDDWTTSDNNKAYNLVLGYSFDMEVEFPNFYVTKQDGERFTSDVHSSLVLHRIKLSLGPTGVYNTTLKRVGKTDYNETFESIMADAYIEGSVAIDEEQVVTLPVYEKNTKLHLVLKSTHPTPSTLYSLNWEGDYSPKYYKRV